LAVARVVRVLILWHGWRSIRTRRSHDRHVAALLALADLSEHRAALNEARAAALTRPTDREDPRP
jgi:methylglyoxal synthase